MRPSTSMLVTLLRVVVSWQVVCVCVLGAGVGVGVPIKPEAPFLWMSKSASRPMKLHWESGGGQPAGCVSRPRMASG